MIKKMILAVMIIFGLSISLFPWLYSNHGECFFIPSECSGGKSASASDSVPVSMLGILIEDGACSYLDSYSYFLGYLKEYEAGNSYAKYSLVKAYESITTADDIYKKIIEGAAGYPYNETAIDRLKSFDYDTYSKTFDLNPRVFSQLRGLLAKGDVRGVFQEIEKRFRTLAEYLVTSRTGIIPEKTGLWRINQAYAETLLFGQYAAEIFDQCR